MNGTKEPGRCAACGWPYAADASTGCVRGNCSQRPYPDRLYDPGRHQREHDGERVERMAEWLFRWTRGAMRMPPIEWSEFHALGKEHIRRHAAEALAAVESA